MSAERPASSLSRALERLAGRWRAFAWRHDERVRDLLVSGRALPAPAGPLLALREAPAPAGADDPTRWVRPASPLSATGRALALARVAIAPRPPAELAVLVASRWDVETLRRVRTAVREAPRPGERAAALARPEPPSPRLGVARPSVFGVDERTGTARAERRGRATAVRPRPGPRALPRPRPIDRLRTDLPVLEPRAFSLGADGTPATELSPLPPRRPPRMPPARATFTANYLDSHRGARNLHVPGPTWGERLRQRMSFWHKVHIGGHHDPTYRWDNDAFVDYMDEVREQMLLRRDVRKLETDEVDRLRMEGPNLGDPMIQVWTGLEFEDLEPEPFEPLKMRLAAPPPPVELPLEGPLGDFAALFRAFREHGEPPPVPELPGRPGR